MILTLLLFQIATISATYGGVTHTVGIQVIPSASPIMVTCDQNIIEPGETVGCMAIGTGAVKIPPQLTASGIAADGTFTLSYPSLDASRGSLTFWPGIGVAELKCCAWLTFYGDAANNWGSWWPCG